MAEEIAEKYQAAVMTVNCEQLKEEDIHRILENVLFEFPIAEVRFFLPKWVEMLGRDHKIKQDLIVEMKGMMKQIAKMKDVRKEIPQSESEFVEDVFLDEVGLDSGRVDIRIPIREKYYFEMLSEMTGMDIENEYMLIRTMKEMSQMKSEYEEVADAVQSVKWKGYGVVSPRKEEIEMEEPSIIKQGSKYGVKIHSKAPSIHMIRANIETEIAPIVGSEQQANDLIRYIKENGNANIFGKTIEELVSEGIRSKIQAIGDESQVKLQDTMQKIVNDSNGGLVCIII